MILIAGCRGSDNSDQSLPKAFERRPQLFFLSSQKLANASLPPRERPFDLSSLTASEFSGWKGFWSRRQFSPLSHQKISHFAGWKASIWKISHFSGQMTCSVSVWQWKTCKYRTTLAILEDTLANGRRPRSGYKKAAFSRVASCLSSFFVAFEPPPN